MQTVQSEQTSTLLDNGNVLISGGIESISGTQCQDATANAQLYNASTKPTFEWAARSSVLAKLDEIKRGASVQAVGRFDFDS
jgi:hypothetical protein